MDMMRNGWLLDDIVYRAIYHQLTNVPDDKMQHAHGVRICEGCKCPVYTAESLHARMGIQWTAGSSSRSSIPSGSGSSRSKSPESKPSEAQPSEQRGAKEASET